MSVVVNKTFYDSTYIRTLDTGSPAKICLRKRVFRLKIGKSRSEYLSTSAFRTTEWENNTFLEAAANKNDFLFGWWNGHSAENLCMIILSDNLFYRADANTHGIFFNLECFDF